MDCGLTKFKVLRRSDPSAPAIGETFAPKPDVGAVERLQVLIQDGYLEPVIEGTNAQTVALVRRRLGLVTKLDSDFDELVWARLWADYCKRMSDPAKAPASKSKAAS